MGLPLGQTQGSLTTSMLNLLLMLFLRLVLGSFALTEAIVKDSGAKTGWFSPFLKEFSE